MDYPSDLLNQMKPDDNIISYLPLVLRSEGFMGEKSSPGGFIAITEQRLIVKATTVTRTTYGDVVKFNYSQVTTNVPISKVSSMSVSSETIKGGCGGKSTVYTLILNVQGGIYNIYVGQNRTTADAFVRSFLDVSE